MTSKNNSTTRIVCNLISSLNFEYCINKLMFQKVTHFGTQKHCQAVNVKFHLFYW